MVTEGNYLLLDGSWAAVRPLLDEVWFLEATDPTGTFRVVQPRAQGVEYGVSHHSGRFLVLTNADGADAVHCRLECFWGVAGVE